MALSLPPSVNSLGSPSILLLGWAGLVCVWSVYWTGSSLSLAKDLLFCVAFNGLQVVGHFWDSSSCIVKRGGGSVDRIIVGNMPPPQSRHHLALELFLPKTHSCKRLTSRKARHIFSVPQHSIIWWKGLKKNWTLCLFTLFPKHA